MSIIYPLFDGLVDGLAHFHAGVSAVSFEFGFEVRVHLERGHDLADGFAVARPVLSCTSMSLVTGFPSSSRRGCMLMVSRPEAFFIAVPLSVRSTRPRIR